MSHSTKHTTTSTFRLFLFSLSSFFVPVVLSYPLSFLYTSFSLPSPSAPTQGCTYMSVTIILTREHEGLETDEKLNSTETKSEYS